MIKNNVFRGILYTFLTAMMVFAGIQAIAMMGGSLEMTAVELYTTLGYTGLLIIAGIAFLGINLFVFAINNYKQFVYYVGNRADKRKAGTRIFVRVYKTFIAAILFAGLVILFTKKLNLIELVQNGNIQLVVFTGLTIIAAVLMLAFEFGDLVSVIRSTRGPKKPRQPKIRKEKKNKKEVPVELKATEKQEKPVFRFGKK